MTVLQHKTEPIIEEVVAGIYRQYPELAEKYGEAGRKKCREDNHHHFDHLETAYEVNETAIFTDYAVWLNEVLTARGMKAAHLIDNFIRIRDAVRNNLDTQRENFYIETLELAITALGNRSSASERKG